LKELYMRYQRACPDLGRLFLLSSNFSIIGIGNGYKIVED
jgi:hypothetical protein